MKNMTHSLIRKKGENIIPSPLVGKGQGGGSISRSPNSERPCRPRGRRLSTGIWVIRNKSVECREKIDYIDNDEFAVRDPRRRWSGPEPELGRREQPASGGSRYLESEEMPR